MGVRAKVGEKLDASLGKERTNRIRQVETRCRRAVAAWIAPTAPPSRASRPVKASSSTAPAKAPARGSAPAPRRPLGEPNDRQGGWIPSDPFVPHPAPKLTRHDLLRGLHEALSPRTYFEIGINEGQSLTLSRARTIAVDPEFRISRPVHCDLQIAQSKSDDFFAKQDSFDHFQGTPIDLAFIDGMHLSEFALRDFMNVEKHLATTGVVLLDDVLPRNALEAARVRLTGAWAGDVYKAVEIIARHRPDLVVLLVNTAPTGTAIVVGADPGSSILAEAYPQELAYLQAEDPQAPPQEYMDRSAAVDPAVLLASDAWPLLVSARETGDPAQLEKAKDILRSLPTVSGQ